ncbi:hypothetical protein BDQ17DRAFT_1387906 [Cyathus striatus]|nr:hypothetical protein BDQ17DRAFT_1387906 [Cyathus striatus]
MITALLIFPFLAIAVHGTVLEARACNTYTIPGMSGGFTKKVSIDFSGTSGGNAVTFLHYHIDDTPYSRDFVTGNVALGTGSLDLKVSAFHGTGSVQSAEVVTSDTFFTGLTVPGVCEGNFMYLDGYSNEVDFEILTSTTLSSNLTCVPAGSWVTNYAASKTTQTIPFTFNPSADFHATIFYIDGVQKAKLTTNVPTLAGNWIWNAWSNGDPCWSNGPPISDSVTHIRSIEMYKGYTSTVKGTTCSI